MKPKQRINFLKLFAMSHLTDVQKAHLSYAVRKDIETIEIGRLYFKRFRRMLKLKRGRIGFERRLAARVSGFFFLNLFLTTLNKNQLKAGAIHCCVFRSDRG